MDDLANGVGFNRKFKHSLGVGSWDRIGFFLDTVATDLFPAYETAFLPNLRLHFESTRDQDPSSDTNVSLVRHHKNWFVKV